MKARCRDRIVALAGDAAELIVHRIRITPRQLGRRHEPQPEQISAMATGKPMKGWVLVQPGGVEADDQLRRWIQRAVKFVGTLPAK